MPGIFVDLDATFPVRVYYKPRLDEYGNETGVDLWNPEEPPEEDGWNVVTGFFRQVDEDSFGSVLEQATIINHVNHRPTLMTKVLRQRVLATYMVGWDVGEDGLGGHPEEERIPIVPGWFTGAKFKIVNRLFVEFMNAVDLVDVVRVAAANDEKFSMPPGFQVPGFQPPQGFPALGFPEQMFQQPGFPQQGFPQQGFLNPAIAAPGMEQMPPQGAQFPFPPPTIPDAGMPAGWQGRANGLGSAQHPGDQS